MPLTPGARLGPYEVTAQIGVGGMGEVYRATDTNLKRQVAIKVLPASVAGDTERLARFQREAEVLAALNHPHIAAIYGLEKTPEFTALVMELAEGEDLSQRIAKGAMPVDEALPIAKQIAEALEAAHEQGIIHRDLKPANIKVRPDGAVKVLDFGLAKAMEPPNALSPSVSQAPTITTPAMTQAGMILGTAAYMSPEQARGKAVDKRADIWAFGAVLFEMLTGQRAFGGDDVSEVLSRVLQREPEWMALPSGLSPTLLAFLRRCLQKDLKQRIGDIHDVRLALEGAFETVGPAVAGATADARPSRRPVRLAILGTAAVVSLVAGVLGWTIWPTSKPGPVRRFVQILPEGQTFGLLNNGRPGMAVAPDGSALAYVSNRGLSIRGASTLEPQLTPATEGATSPVFSPDGQEVAYFVNGQLMRMATTGGSAVVVVEGVTDPFGLSWADDGMMLLGQADGIYQVPATGGALEKVIPARDGERLWGGQLLPDSESVLFTATRGSWDQGEVVVQSRGRDDRTVLLKGGFDARYLPTGHLVYAQGNGLFGMAFDPDRRTVSGGAKPLVRGVRRGQVSGASFFSVSGSGELVYIPLASPDVGPRTLMWVSRDRRETPITIEPRGYSNPRISPDGTRVALTAAAPGALYGDLWVWDFARETGTRLTVGAAGVQFPIWTPDGTRLAYGDSARNIFWKSANNTGMPELLAAPTRAGSGDPNPYFFTPDGAAIVFREPLNPKTGENIGRVAVKTGTEPAWLLEEAFAERNAVLSPDGRWMAYESNESGREEIYVRPFPNVDDNRVQVSNGGGKRPLWSRDGRELFYLEEMRAPARLMSAVVQTKAGLSVESRTALMDWPYFLGATGRTYDVSLDGQRFLVLAQTQRPAYSDGQLIVVENWFEDLKRLVPTQ